jgi:hypothetical protein
MARGKQPKIKRTKNPEKRNTGVADKHGAFLTGASEFPVSASRYSQHALAWLGSNFENFTDEEKKEIHRTINNRHDDPAVFSDRINGIRNNLRDKYPTIASAGEVAAEAATGGALLKSVANLEKGAGQAYKYVDRLFGTESKTRAVPILGALSTGIASEAIVDPAIQKYIEPEEPEKKKKKKKPQDIGSGEL